MASTTVVKVKVQELTKFGFKHEGRFVNYSKQLDEADKTKVVPGAEFAAEFYVADSGKEYLNKILASASSQPVRPGVAVADTLAKSVDTERAKKFTPKFNKPATQSTGEGMSKAEWADKDQRISRQGVIQAAVIALAPVVSLETLGSEAVKLAEAMLLFVNNKKA